jgi:amino acid transporter
MAEAGSRVSLTGGPYAYVEVAFGPFVGFLIGFLLWMLVTFAMAAVATVILANLGALVPALASPTISALVLVMIYAGFAAVNIMGVERGARVNTALTIAKLLPLVLLIVAGMFAVEGENLVAAEPPELATLARSSLLLLFVFAGIEAALVPGGEVKDPARTVPRAIFNGDRDDHRRVRGAPVRGPGRAGAGAKAAPLADAAGVALGGWGRQLLLVGAVVSMLGHVGAMILAALARTHPL